jgi:hypothetical protein
MTKPFNPRDCPECGGDGLKVPCLKCNGRRTIPPEGLIGQPRECNTCGGTGEVPRLCPTCGRG